MKKLEELYWLASCQDCKGKIFSLQYIFECIHCSSEEVECEMTDEFNLKISEQMKLRKRFVKKAFQEVEEMNSILK